MKILLSLFTILVTITSTSEGNMEPQRNLDKSKPYAIVNTNGIIDFLKNDKPFGSIRLSVFGNNWSYNDQSSAVIDKDENSQASLRERYII